MNTFVKPAARRAAGALIATVPLSAVMVVGQRLGWMREQPPEILTEEGLLRAGLLDGKSTEAVHVFATANHFAFGAAGGAFYALLRQVVPIPAPVPIGVAFGLGIWAASYRGWIPAMNILPAEQHPGMRGTLVMIAAHAVYRGHPRSAQPKGETVPDVARRLNTLRSPVERESPSPSSGTIGNDLAALMQRLSARPSAPAGGMKTSELMAGST